MHRLYAAFIFFVSVYCAGCSSGNAPKNRGAIVFGDSSMIVTESDPNYLSDNVTDFVPPKAVIPDTARPVTVVMPEQPKSIVAEQVKTIPPQVQKPVGGKGLEVPFKSLHVFIAGIQAHTAKPVDWNTAKGVSYTLDVGELNAKSIILNGAAGTKIMQRYQTVVLLQTPGGKAFKLPGLPVSTSQWQTLNGANGKYPITGIGKGQLRYENRFSANALRNATQKLARNNRMNKKEEEQLLKSIHNVKAANQLPAVIAMQSIVWKISAKDAAGKSIERELRIDINR